MMTAKKILALLLSVLMLVALFSACANNSGSESSTPADSGESASSSSTGSSSSTSSSSTGSSSSASSGSKTESSETSEKEEENTPVENEPLTITYMGNETHSWGYTLEEAIAKGMATYDYYNEKMLEEQNLICNVDIIDSEAYKTTLSGYLAGNMLPDVFLSKDQMDLSVFKNAMTSGRFASIPDLIEYSDGTFADLVKEGGIYDYLRAWCISPEGDWYYLALANDCKTSINFDHDDVHYLDTFPVLSWYPMNIRVDWLRKCGLEKPKTADEFTQALVQFQENDVNGNGTKDERAFLGIAMPSEQVFQHTTAGWFGLPHANFAMNSITGKIENPVDFGDQYLAFVDYTADLYNKGVALAGEGNVWGYGTNVAGNFCAAHTMYPDNLLTCETGDPDTQWESMPIIQALEGVTPILRGQACTLSAISGISFRNDVDKEAAGAYLDWLYGPTLCRLLTYGIEGKAYDIKPDGTLYRYVVGVDFTAEEEEQYGDMWHYAPSALFPQVQAKLAWDLIGTEYQSIEEALDNGEPYTWAGMTFDDWKEKFAPYNWDDISPLERFLYDIIDFGPDNIEFSIGSSVTTLATDEEVDTISQYGTDLKTYLAEMTTGYIIGTASTDTYESDLQFAYDNLGMQEYVNALQAQTDRFLVAMGRDPILG